MIDMPSPTGADSADPDGDATSSGGRVPRWLWRAPIADPIDRRNAPMLQVVLLFLGCAPPLMWLYRAFASDIPWRDGEIQSMVVSLMISAVAMSGVLLIRRGRFQWAIRQTLALIAAAMIFSYATAGTTSQAFEQPLQVVWMVLAGLMIGRRALWLTFACVVIAYTAGGVVDVRNAASAIDTPLNVTMSVVIESVMFLLIAVVIDRSVQALRESLGEATRRGDALAVANHRLEAEMAERKKAEQQLIHAQKVEVVGRLASGIAHDFNHLLGLILGYASRGLRTTDGVELKEILGGIDAAGRRATAVTRKLLDFSRIEATKIEEFDVADALRDLKPMLRQLFDPRVRIALDVSADRQMIAFDRAQLDLVVLNIAANANHAMPDGGEFHARTRVLADVSAVEMEFRDTGRGIHRNVSERLFEPFFTTKPAGQGTGLGLSVSKNLVNAAGGDITFESEVGAGSTFRVRLPMAGLAHA
ncbi:MAG: HAMP domain-containing sensor histidine kinase [Dokdonella sp.]|uniref:sensor histidine kinase n=1 Tax=Dokdonella sp. TaxID=2291710 RepID=UPI003266D70E